MQALTIVCDQPALTVRLFDGSVQRGHRIGKFPTIHLEFFHIAFPDEPTVELNRFIEIGQPFEVARQGDVVHDEEGSAAINCVGGCYHADDAGRLVKGNITLPEFECGIGGEGIYPPDCISTPRPFSPFARNLSQACCALIRG